MRLIEAIRLGSMTTRQITSNLWNATDGACAIGAAYIAVGMKDALNAMFDQGHHVDARHMVHGVFPILADEEAVATCPVPECRDHGHYTMQVTGMATHLNDCHGWDRPRIADRLEPYEIASEHRRAVAAARDAVECI